MVGLPDRNAWKYIWSPWPQVHVLWGLVQELRGPSAKIPMYRTDLQGAVHEVSDGLKWTITTEADRDDNALKNQKR